MPHADWPIYNVAVDKISRYKMKISSHCVNPEKGIRVGFPEMTLIFGSQKVRY